MRGPVEFRRHAQVVIRVATHAIIASDLPLAEQHLLSLRARRVLANVDRHQASRRIRGGVQDRGGHRVIVSDQHRPRRWPMDFGGTSMSDARKGVSAPSPASEAAAAGASFGESGAPTGQAKHAKPPGHRAPWIEVTR